MYRDRFFTQIQLSLLSDCFGLFPFPQPIIKPFTPKFLKWTLQFFIFEETIHSNKGRLCKKKNPDQTSLAREGCSGCILCAVHNHKYSMPKKQVGKT